MSQTLSLEPGEYALFIKPPVAGVDFTGTPLPSVSYQWKKNGTAIAGQTNATISGVWVEQSGGTVDLVNGDVISIDIILTNPVSVATKTIAATIDSAIPAPVISPVSVRQLSGGTYQTVTSLANTDIGEQVIVASNTGGTVTTTPPVLTTYQWRRGYGAIAGATAQTYTLQAADADSIIDCVVTATNAGGTTTATATVVVGTADAGGWTELTPSADSRLIYVSNDGDDVAAANVKGRGYYLPSDDEIGADPTNPAGPIVAYRTAFEACKRVRGWHYNGTDYPGGIPQYGSAPLPGVTGYADWLMLRRNQSYQVEEVPTAWGGQFWTVGEMAGGWVQVRGVFAPETGGLVGRSVSEPTVITAWGPPSEPRPVYDSFGINRRAPKVAYVSIETPNKLKVGDGVRGDLVASDVLLEDLSCAGAYAGNITSNDMMRVRRCTLTGAWLDGDVQGWFEGTLNDTQNGDNIVWEECVFDMNGYEEDPNDATTWTRGVAHFVTASPGLGVQPKRSSRNRNMYLSRYASVTLRGSIISRSSGTSAVQMREGGLAERNLFLWNAVSLSMVHPQMTPSRHKGALVKDNVVLHDDHMLTPGSWGGGIGNAGVSNTTAVADGNIIAHFHRGNNGTHALSAVGKPYRPEPEPPEKLGQAIIVNNAMYHQYGNDTFLIEGEDRLSVDGNVPSGVVSATVSNNAFATNGYIAMAADTAKPAAFTFSGNKFHSPSGDGLFRWGWEVNNGLNYDRLPYSDGGFSQWQAAGYDTDATFTNDFAAFKAAAGWTAPERDILSYMQSVDPTYVVNEDVYVDEFASVTQATRQRVWESLSNPALAGDQVISEERAKQAARRYHACLTFIERAKANRKGAWDTRWTAEAVNNYIREGFGKAPVTGPYDNRPIATRIAEYTS